MLKKLITNYLQNSNKIIFTDQNNSYYRSKFLEKVNYFKKELNKIWLKNNLVKGVAIYLDRDINYFALIFACWLCDAYYLPLSKNSSKENISYQIKRSNVGVIVSYNKKFIFKKLKKRENETSNKLAYIIFTSGSTGSKKGVKISYRNFNAYLKSLKHKFKNTFKSKSLLINGEITFDIVNADIAFALLYDCEICITEDSKNIFSLFDILERRKVESVYAVPSMWENICFFALSQNKKFKFIKNINSGGELLNLDLYRKIKSIAPKSIFHNFYGPTEFTINATCCEINEKNIKKGIVLDENNNLSIGKPLKGVDLKIKNKKKSLIGEMLLSGEQLMDGYVNDKDNGILKIKNKFYYSTGDIVKLNKHKNIFFLGRNKDYIKIKGYRININQISNIITNKIKYKSILQHSNNKLILFIETKNKKIHLNMIKKKIFRSLEFYEVPNEYIIIKNFPKLTNGKINLKKLAS